MSAESYLRLGIKTCNVRTPLQVCFLGTSATARRVLTCPTSRISSSSAWFASAHQHQGRGMNGFVLAMLLSSSAEHPLCLRQDMFFTPPSYCIGTVYITQSQGCIWTKAVLTQKHCRQPSSSIHRHATEADDTSRSAKRSTLHALGVSQRYICSLV